MDMIPDLNKFKSGSMESENDGARRSNEVIET